MSSDNQRIGDFVTLLSRCSSAEKAHQLFQQQVARLGFSHCLYVLYSPTVGSDDGIHYCYGNYRQEFLNAYYELASGTMSRDIAVDWCTCRTDLLLWEGEYYRKLVQNVPDYQRQNSLSHDFGVKYGVTVPFDTGSRLYKCGIGLSATGVSEWEFRSDILPKIELVQILGHYLDCFTRDQPHETVFQQATSTNLPPLSVMELQTLKWLANGQSLQTIADEKLFRSLDSINRYIRSARTKLRARNRDQLIARAVFLGLVEPL